MASRKKTAGGTAVQTSDAEGEGRVSAAEVDAAVREGSARRAAGSARGAEEAPLSHADDARGRRPHREEALSAGQDRRRRVHRPRAGGDLGRVHARRWSRRTTSSRRTATWASTHARHAAVQDLRPVHGPQGRPGARQGRQHAHGRPAPRPGRRSCRMLADSVPIVAGAGMAFRFRKEPRIAITFNGEGSTTRGDWHEGINFAAVQKANCVYVVQQQLVCLFDADRGAVRRARTWPTARSATASPGYVIDGNDAEAVWRTAMAVDRARAHRRGPVDRRVQDVPHDRALGARRPSHYVPTEMFPRVGEAGTRSPACRRA